MRPARSSAPVCNARRPLAIRIAALFAASMPVAAIADNWTVDSCDADSHSTPGANHGTLRYALANASSPAILDLTGLTACTDSKITLTTGSGGELFTDVATLTINGPGADVLTVDASSMIGAFPSYGDDRVLLKSTAGTLTIANLGIGGGHVLHSIHETDGGCIFANGDLELDGVKVSNCYVASIYDSDYAAAGGAIKATGNVTLDGSKVTGSRATAAANFAAGGAIYAGGAVTLKNTSGDPGNNAAVGYSYVKSGTQKAVGGGIYAKGAVSSTQGFIYYNNATSTGGAALGAGVYATGNVSLTDSVVTGNAASSKNDQSAGGGVFTTGDVNLIHALVKYSEASSQSTFASGGGVYAGGALTLMESTLSMNSTGTTNLLSKARGGGASAGGTLFASYSTIDRNTASGPGFGGGLYARGASVTLVTSTVSRNVSEGAFGGIDVFSGGAPGTLFQTVNSTISGNDSSHQVGGVYVDSATAKFFNTTIAFNTATSDPGLQVRGHAAPMELTFQSNLLSNNTYGTSESDLGVNGSITVNGGNLGTAANNLVRVTSLVNAVSLPADTKFGSCPHLGPLRDNGGLTKTHALLSTSIAIDNGNTNFGSLPYDQRGALAVNGVSNYARVSGPAGNPNPKADIGAHEVQQNDVVFDVDFEDCPVLE